MFNINFQTAEPTQISSSKLNLEERTIDEKTILHVIIPILNLAIFASQSQQKGITSSENSIYKYITHFRSTTSLRDIF